jgi:hypothetical protein
VTLEAHAERVDAFFPKANVKFVLGFGIILNLLDDAAKKPLVPQFSNSFSLFINVKDIYGMFLDVIAESKSKTFFVGVVQVVPPLPDMFPYLKKAKKKHCFQK